MGGGLVRGVFTMNHSGKCSRQKKKKKERKNGFNRVVIHRCGCLSGFHCTYKHVMQDYCWKQAPKSVSLHFRTPVCVCVCVCVCCYVSKQYKKVNPLVIQTGSFYSTAKMKTNASNYFNIVRFV